MSRLPVVGRDLSVWANDMRRYLGRQLDRLTWRVGGQTASENGMILWDEVGGSPVVSRDGIWANVSALENTVYVSRPEQLTGVIDSTKIYIIDGIIDIGTGTIDVPTGGMYIQGLGFGVSKICSLDDNVTLFTYSGAYSGDLFIFGIDMEASGTGSKVFDLDNAENFGACECVSANFSNCTSLGELANYRQGLWNNVALLSCVDGLTMSGNWLGGFSATTAIVVGTTFTGTIFKAGTALVLSGRFITDMNALNIADAGAFCDFAPANIANKISFLVRGVSVNFASNSFPNMPRGDPKARFSQCVGTQNTYVGAQWTVTTAAATTTVANTPVKLAGTTTYTDEQWFSDSVDNAFVYEGGPEVGVDVNASISFSGTNGHKVKTIIQKWVNATSSYVVIATGGSQTMNASNKVESVSAHGFATLSANDRIEIWVENDTTGSVTMQLDGLVSVKERAS